MKTTVDISDALIEAAKRRARAQGTTLRALIEEGLRAVLANGDDEAFVLRDAAVDGSGLLPDVRGGGWERMVERVYEGRGG